MSAEIPRALREKGPEEARRLLDWYYEVFGPDNFYIELQRHDIPELEKINRELLALGKRYEAKFIATNDVHYINQPDARLQDILLAIQTGALITDPNRFRMSVDSFYLRSPEEMASLFARCPKRLPTRSKLPSAVMWILPVRATTCRASPFRRATPLKPICASCAKKACAAGTAKPAQGPNSARAPGIRAESYPPDGL